MSVHIGLLRAVNLAAHNKVGMAPLCRLVERAGMRDVRSILQTGNLVFRSDVRSTVSMERILERAAADGLHLETDFFVRTAKEWGEIVDANPLPAEAQRDPAHLLVFLLKKEAGAPQAGALSKAIVGREVVRIRGRAAYITYPDGIGRSRLTSAVIERHLGTRATGRNWNTVLKIAALAAALEDRRDPE